MTSRPFIVWFRDDLRLSDHPALHAASKTGAPVICLYVLDEESRAARQAAARRCGALVAGAIAAGLAGEAFVRPAPRWCCGRGAAATIIAEVARETDARAVFWNEIAQAPHLAVAGQVSAALAGLGVSSQSFPGDLLVAPGQHPQQGGPGPAGVHAVLAAGAGARRSAKAVAGAEEAVRRPETSQATGSRAGISSRRSPDWAGGLRESWTPGEAPAQARLKTFSRRRRGLCQRARPARPRRTSRLSPHLRFGEISPRQILHAARFAAAEHPRLSARHREIPERTRLARILPSSAVRRSRPRDAQPAARFDAFPWKHDDKALRAWQRGRTGYPDRRCRHARALAHRRGCTTGCGWWWRRS